MPTHALFTDQRSADEDVISTMEDEVFGTVEAEQSDEERKKAIRFWCVEKFAA